LGGRGRKGEEGKGDRDREERVRQREWGGEGGERSDGGAGLGRKEVRGVIGEGRGSGKEGY